MKDAALRDKIKNSSPIGTVRTFFVYYVEEYDTCYYILSNRSKDHIEGYLSARHVVDDIWQVQTAIVKTKGKGIGSDLYHFVIRIGNAKQNVTKKRIINDTQLSTDAEKLWLKTLPKLGITLKIFDRKLQTTYTFDDLNSGKLTPDGVKLIHPKQDVVDTVQDYDNSTMRFFLLAESNQVPKIHNLRQAWLEKGDDDMLIESCTRQGLSPNVILGFPNFAKDGEF
jgi:hypothetical protein